jgi:hypothetical protein
MRVVLAARLGGLALAGMALSLALAAANTLPASAGDSGATPRATPVPFAVSVIEPLREIGRIKARTPFCRAFLEHAALGVGSAITFEAALLDTVQDFRNAKSGDELNKYLSVRRLEQDLNRLADLSLAGRAELEQLKSIPTDSARHDELVAFVDAINGAKGRQMDLARKLSSKYAKFAEQPVYTNVTLPSDTGNGTGNGFTGSTSNSYGITNVLDTGDFLAAFELRQDVFDALPGDELVGSDLARAADHGKTAMALGGC